MKPKRDVLRLSVEQERELLEFLDDRIAARKLEERRQAQSAAAAASAEQKAVDLAVAAERERLRLEAARKKIWGAPAP